MLKEKTSEHHPGTVSRILWHFTGGPRWNEKENRQNIKLKPAKEAFDILIKILGSKLLKLGKYAERLEISVPRSFLLAGDSLDLEGDPPVYGILESSPVCCLADVPIMHLEYISKRYNKFAIGFRRDSVIEKDFNPVLYTLKDKDIVRQLFRSMGNLSIDSRVWYNLLQSELQKLKSNESKSIYMDSFNKIGSLIEDMVKEAKLSKEGLSRLFAFVKCFNKSEFHTIYCEREWRSTKKYKFSYDDIALIVIPKEINNVKYYKMFCEECIDELSIPKMIPVVPWEDIVEY